MKSRQTDSINKTRGTILKILLLLMLFCSIAVTASAYELSEADIQSATVITIDTPVSVSISEGGAYRVFSFTPTEDGKYYVDVSNSFYAIDLTIFDSNATVLESSVHYNNDKLFITLSRGQKYYLTARLPDSQATDSFNLRVGKNVPVRSISLSGLDGVQLYPGDWKDFTWTVEPSNATNQQIWLEMDETALGLSWYSDEKRCDIQGYKSGEYTITVHSSDNESITSTATVNVLSLANVEKTTLTLDETATVTINESGKFRLFSFTPETTDKYFFSISSASSQVHLTLFSSNWIRLTDDYLFDNYSLVWQMTGGETYYVKA